MPEYLVSETLTWKIYADTQEEAERIWNNYLDQGVTQAQMKLKDIEHDKEW